MEARRREACAAGETGENRRKIDEEEIAEKGVAEERE